MTAIVIASLTCGFLTATIILLWGRQYNTATTTTTTILNSNNDSSQRFQVFSSTDNDAIKAISARASPVTPSLIAEFEITVTGHCIFIDIVDWDPIKPDFAFEGDDITEDQDALEQLLKLKVITVASDGGKYGDPTTYGWIIAADETIVYEGYGSVLVALTTSSFRGEAYRALAAISCLLQAFLDNC
jgi:hypothetical protein